MARNKQSSAARDFAKRWEGKGIELKNLGTDYYRLQFLVDTGNEHLKKELEISLQAGQIIGEIYDEFLKQYINPNDPNSLKSLNVLCVRLVFCLYAEDAGIFGEKRYMFHDYLSQFKPGEGDMRRGLIDLFEILNTPIEKRSPYTPATLKAFPYCNGGLFADRDVEIPFFNDKIAHLILKNASDDFDWSQISPTIFGAVFESTLNPETRRSGGMHYTSIENIHKVIDPLFLDELKSELSDIKAEPVEKTRIRRAFDYQDKLSSLKFLDPACGSGNFLTETYLSLRRLENEAIQIQMKGHGPSLGAEFTPIKVSIHQFYGIEINDFAVATATTALWIAESQMLAETEKIMQTDLDFLPLKTYRNIVEGNALRMDWSRLDTCEPSSLIYADRLNVIRPDDVTDASVGMLLKESTDRYGELNVVTNDVHFGMPERQTEPLHFDYILGNPPFVGARFMSTDQKSDIVSVFGKQWKNVGNLDYVCGWYKKASEYMKATDFPVKAAFVSTNSISQGEQVADLWKPLFEYGIHIDFAWRTFRWDSEATLKAHVHCVIIGFSYTENQNTKQFFETGKSPVQAQNINGYLIDGENVFIESRFRPLCDIPTIGIGNQPIDNGNYLFSKEEMDAFVKTEPSSRKWFKPFYGSQEFINKSPRYCLWLGECPPNILRGMPKCLRRVEAVKQFRNSSNRASTVRLANKPTRFQTENMPSGTFIVIPRVSSQNRRYVPIGFMPPDIMVSDAVHIISDATLYHFGVLTSNVHNSWMRAICGRLKSDYRYSKDIVYNNFPWPTPSEAQKSRIEQTAQAILDIREKYPDCSLADLYDEITMPADLRKAHQENDRAVMEAYGFDWRKMAESECVAALFKLYQQLTK